MRTLTSGGLYHIYNHANGFEDLFREPRNYEYFLEKYRFYISPIAETLCYCLLPNHFHFCIRLKEEEEVVNMKKFKLYKNNLRGLKDLGGLVSAFYSQQFSNFFNSYAKSFNLAYGRMGSLFMSNFRRKLVESDSYLITLVLYIHVNPIHHRMSDDIYEWPYSSFHEYCEEAFDIVDWKWAKEVFPSRREMIRLHLEKELSLLTLEV